MPTGDQSPLLQVMGDEVVEALELLNVPSYPIDAAGSSAG